MSENDKTDPASRRDSGVEQGENTTPEGARAGSGGEPAVTPHRGPKDPPPDPPVRTPPPKGSH